MFEWQLVDRCTGGNDDVRSGSCDALFPGIPRQCSRSGPNLFVDRIKPQFLLQFRQRFLFRMASRSAPKLHQGNVAPGRFASNQECFDTLSGRAAASAQKFNPTGSVHQPHLAAFHFRSFRILWRSCWVMNPGQEPCSRSAISSNRCRRLNSLTAVTTASRLVFAPVRLIAS